MRVEALLATQLLLRGCVALSCSLTVPPHGLLILAPKEEAGPPAECPAQALAPRNGGFLHFPSFRMSLTLAQDG